MQRLAIVLGLSFGALVYLARPTDPSAVRWAEEGGLGQLAECVHHAREVVHARVHLPAWFMGAASDATFGIAVGAAFARAPSAVVILGAFAAIAHEIAQGLRIVPGTFDAYDLMVLTVGYTLSVALFRHRIPVFTSFLNRCFPWSTRSVPFVVTRPMRW